MKKFALIFIEVAFPPATMMIIVFVICGLFVLVLLYFCFLTCNTRRLISFKSYILGIILMFVLRENTLLKKKKIQPIKPDTTNSPSPSAARGPEQNFQCGTQSR